MERGCDRRPGATIKEFSVDITPDDVRRIEAALAGRASVPDTLPGRKTFAFDEAALTAISDGDFERFLWTAFDRVEERDGIITLSRGTGVTFYLPVAKLMDPEIRRAIRDFVTGRVGLNS